MDTRRTFLSYAVGLPLLTTLTPSTSQAQNIEGWSFSDQWEWDENWVVPGVGVVSVHRIVIRGTAAPIFDITQPGMVSGRYIVLPGFEMDERGRIVGQEEDGLVSLPERLAEAIKVYDDTTRGMPVEGRRHHTHLTLRGPKGRVSYHLGVCQQPMTRANMVTRDEVRFRTGSENC